MDFEAGYRESYIGFWKIGRAGQICNDPFKSNVVEEKRTPASLFRPKNLNN